MDHRNLILLRSLLKVTFQYFPYTIDFIQQNKILRKNIERLGAALLTDEVTFLFLFFYIDT